MRVCRKNLPRFVMQEFDGAYTHVFLHRRMLGITDIAEIIVDERDLQYGRDECALWSVLRVWRQHFCCDPGERFAASSLRKL